MKKQFNEMTIGDFLDFTDSRKDTYFICDEAVKWLKKLGRNHPLEYAWDRCSRPQWMEWGLYLLTAKNGASGRNYYNSIEGLRLIRKIKAEHGMNWRGDQMFDDNIRIKDAKIIRENFNPFI